MSPRKWTSPSTFDQIPPVMLALISFACHLTASATNSALWLILGSTFSVVSCAWTQCLVGPRSHKGFRAVQPFNGGESHILYQGHAWVWLGAYLLSVTVLLCNWGAIVRAKTVILALGAMSLCPCGLVLLSIPYYRLDGVPSRARKCEIRLSSLVMTVVCSSIASFVAWVLSCQGWSYAGIMFSAAGAFIAHFHGGSKLSGWRHVQAFHGGPYFAILQGHAWTTFAAAGCINLLGGLGILRGLVGVGFVAGLLQFAAVAMLSVSLFLFDATGAALKQVQPDSTRALISNVCLLFAILHFPIVSALTLTGHSSFCSSRGMNWFMLLSMPIAHLVSTHCLDGYSFIQPASGGIEFMIMQSYSWTIFGIASFMQVALTVNDMCIPILTVLLSVSGWFMMALSVRYFESPGQEISRGPSGPLTMEVPRGGLSDLLMALAGGLGVWSALIASEVVEWNSTEGLAWMLIVTIGSCNIAGFHILWTWTHGALAALLLATGDERGIAIFACIGFSVAWTWYSLFAKYFRLQVPVRAMRGWGKWCMDAAGPFIGHKGHSQDWYPSHCQPVFIQVGFHLIDIAFHFFPPLMLLQVSASLITPSSVVVAHFVTRLWFFLVSTHHYALLPAELAKNGLRVAKFQNNGRGAEGASPTAVSILQNWVSAEAWVDSDVLSHLYGMDPPLPKGLANFALKADFTSSLLLFGLSLLPQPLRTNVFFTMGFGRLLTPQTMLKLMALFGVPGIVCFAVVFPLSFRSWPEPHPFHMDMYKKMFEPNQNPSDSYTNGGPIHKALRKDQ